MSKSERTPIEVLSDMYMQALRGNRYFAHLNDTQHAKEQTLASLRESAETAIARIPWLLCSLLAVVFGISLQSRSPLVLTFFWTTLIALTILFSVIIRKHRTALANNFCEHPVIKDLTGQIDDPAKAFFTLCKDDLHRAMGEIDLLKRPFPHVCTMFTSLNNLYKTLSKKVHQVAGGIDINLHDAPKYWDDNLRDLYYLERDLACIKRGIDHVFSSALTPEEQDDLCNMSRLRRMCVELQKNMMNSSLIAHFSSEKSLFLNPYPINVLTNENIISHLDGVSAPFRALSRPIC